MYTSLVRTPLLERDTELRHLAAAVSAAARRGGSLTVVEGPPGIGKSRLLLAAREIAGEHGVAVLAARATDLGRGDPFGVARQLTGTPAAEDVPPVSERDARSALAFRLAWAVAERSLAVVVDDLQWCDRESVGVLCEALAQLEERGCAVILARRLQADADTEALAELLRAPGATVLRPRALSDHAVRALIEQELGDPPAAPFVEACLTACAGNPFLLHELLLELRGRTIAPSEANVHLVPDIGPHAVAEYVACQLATASAAAGDVARAVAILRDDAELDAAAELAGIDADAAHEAAHELRRLRIFGSGSVPEFAHAIVEAAVVGALAPSALSAGHRAAARILSRRGRSATVVGNHLTRCVPASDAWVVEQLRAAAADALAQGAPQAAAALYARALREPPDEAEVARAQMELGAALAIAGDGAALGHLEIAVGRLEDPDLRADATLQLARLHERSGDYDAATAALRTALASDIADPERRLSLQAQLVSTMTLAHDPGVEQMVARLTLDDAAEGRPGRSEGALLNAAADVLARLQGRERELALRLARRALTNSRLALEPNTLTFANAAHTLVLADCLDEALAYLDAAALAATRQGVDHILLDVVRTRALTLCGKLEEAVTVGRAALEPGRTLALQARFYLAGLVAAALVELGDPGAAAEAIEECDPRTDSASMTSVHAARAALHNAAGRSHMAVAEARLCGRLCARYGTHNPAYHAWQSEAAFALVAIGDRRAAATLADEELELARAWGSGRSIARALRALAAAGDQASAVELLRQAEAAIAGSEALLERATVAVALGAALRRAGDDTAARRPLSDGVELAERCCAAPLAARALDELVAAGGRPRRGRSGPVALTPAERRVATLAATGASNAQIAREIIASPATVATHLHRVYRKLGIGSRRQLAQVLGDSERD